MYCYNLFEVKFGYCPQNYDLQFKRGVAAVIFATTSHPDLI